MLVVLSKVKGLWPNMERAYKSKCILVGTQWRRKIIVVYFFTLQMLWCLVNHIDDKKSINQTIISHDYEGGKFSGYGWPCFTKSENILNPIHGFLVQDAITIEVNISIDGLQRVYDYRYSMAHEMKALLSDESTADHYIIIRHTDNDQSMTSPSTTTCSSQKRSIEMMMVDSPVDEASYSNHRIPVHKLILEQRSPVFKTMLSSTMKVSTSNKIIITNFDHDVVREFIRFLYLENV